MLSFALDIDFEIFVEKSNFIGHKIWEGLSYYKNFVGTTDVIGLEAAGYLVNSYEEYWSGEYTRNQKIMALLPGGGYSDVATVNRNHVMPIPEGMSFKKAAAIPETYLTAYNLLFLNANGVRGETWLVHAAASGVGCAAIQLCKLKGLNSIAVASSQEKLDFGKSLGAMGGINYKETPDFSKLVKEMTNNKGVDIILDCIGAQNYKANLSAAAIDSRWIFFGAMGGVKLNDVNLVPFLLKRVSLIGSTLKSRSDEYKSHLVKSFAEECLPHFQTGKLTPIIDSVYKLSEVGLAHERMEKNLNIGKIVMVNDL